MWSRKYQCCELCGGVKFKHVAYGLCNACYQKLYREDPKNKERIAADKHKWYKENINPETQKVTREAAQFGGLRDTILERDGHQCTTCGVGPEGKLTVHHKDGNGRGSREPNNTLDNLVTLCRKCHSLEHELATEAKKWRAKEGDLRSIRWSRKYLHCTNCGRNDVEHASRGYCTVCYPKLRLAGKFKDDARA